MFGQVLDKLNSWLGPSFLLSRYFPWLLFFIANLLLAALEFQQVRTFLVAEYGSIASSDKVVDLLVALVGVAVVAYTVSPATQFITRMMEGQTLWPWIAEPLTLGESLRREKLQARYDELLRERAGLPGRDEIIKRLGRIREAGTLHKRATNAEAIAAATTAVEKLRVSRYLNRPVKRGEFLSALDALSNALRDNCADLGSLDPSTATEADFTNAKNLDELHRAMVSNLARYATDVAKQQEARAKDVLDRQYGHGALAPTRLGNEVAALRSYCTERYGMEFDFFWPRIQVTMKNEKLASALSTAKIQLDFSILSFTLSAAFVLVWLAILLFLGQSLLVFAIVVLAGPPVVAISLWMVHENYAAFAELVRSAIDLSRFDLLQAMRLPLPAGRKDEQVTWNTLGKLLVLGAQDVDITFKHPSS